MSLEDDALALLEQHPHHDTLVPLYYKLSQLLPYPKLSERVLLFGRYVELIQAAQTWTELPYCDQLADIDHIYRILTASPDIVTGSVDYSRLQDKHPVWSTCKWIPRFEADALTGLFAIMVIISHRGDHRLTSDLGSTLRQSRFTLRQMSRKEQRAREAGELQVELLNTVLASLPLAPSPAQQYQVLLDELQRIEGAKPNLARILRHRLTRHFQPIERDLPAINLGSFPLAEQSNEADGPDEDLGEADYTYYTDMLDQLDTPIDVQRSYHLQAIWSNNPLALEGHVTALTHREALAFAKWLKLNLELTAEGRQIDRLTSLLLLTLVLISGRTLGAADALLRSIGSNAWTPFGQLVAQKEQIVLPAPLPEGAYKPCAKSKDLLFPALDQFRLDLPKPVASALKAWIADGLPSVTSDHHRQVYELLSEYKANGGPDISLGRLRQYLGTRLTSTGKDPAITLWLTGDSRGHSTGYLHYANVCVSDLADTYTKAVWPLFNQHASGERSRSSDVSVGSRAVPKEKYLQKCVNKFSHRFNASDFSKNIPSAVADRHNLMVNYLSSILTAVVGHRISSALLELKRGDFCLSMDGNSWTGVATFSDKRRDAAHHFRPAALGRHVAEQVGLYLLHLSALEKLLDKHHCSDSSRTMVAAALDGSGPLFFWLDQNLDCKSTDFSAWHKEFQSTFEGLPSNFGRHYLAYSIRRSESTASSSIDHTSEVGCGELSCLALGHFSVIGNPFGNDSPTDILSMATALGHHVDRVYEQQGWIRRGGLASAPKRFHPDHVLYPDMRLKTWRSERESLERALQQQQKRINQGRKEKYDSEKDSALSEFLTAIHSIHPELAAGLYSVQNTNRHAAPMTLSRKQLSDALSRGPGGADLDEMQRSKVTWAKLRVVRSLLLRAQRAGLYQGPLPAKALRHNDAEQTPLLSGVYQAYDTFLRLRADLPSLLAHDLTDGSQLSPRRLYAHIAIASILYGSVFEKDILDGLLQHFTDYKRSPTDRDSVLVEIQSDPPITWALWGLPAALIVKFNQRDQCVGPPSLDDLSAEIWNILPSKFRPRLKDNTLDCLLDTASVVANLELSGIARLALGTDSNTCSWSLEIERQLALLEGTEDSRSLVAQPKKAKQWGRLRHDFSSDWYSWLCATIPADTKSSAKNSENRRTLETNRRHRLPAARAIESRMTERKLSEIEQALGYWTIQMLISKKPSGPGLYAHTTIYNYLTSIGPGIINQVQDRKLSEIEDDEWSEIYEKILDGHREGTLNRKLLQILRLHALMERRFNASPLPDDCLPVKDQVESRVRNCLALPTEISLALDGLERSAVGDKSHPISAREVMQAYIAFVLMAATGCRIGEISGLQHRDIDISKNKVLIRIRLNDYRRIKSRAAARIIPIELSDSQVSVIRTYLDSEKRRLGGAHFRPTRIAFLDLSRESRGLPVGTETLRPFITSSLRQVSPINLISYDLRHARGTYFQAEMALSAKSSPDETTTETSIRLPHICDASLRLPRWTFSRAMVMGHAFPRTTNHSYGGMPWLYLVPSGQRHMRFVTSEAVGSLLEISPQNAARWMSRQATKKKNKEQYRSLLDRLTPKKPRNVNACSTKRSVDLDELRREQDIPNALIYLLYAKEEDQENSFLSYGLSVDDYHRLRQSAKAIMEETRFSFLHSLGRGEELGRAGAPPRWYTGSEALLAITSEMTKPSSPIWDISSSYRKIMNPKQRQSHILLERDKGEQLVALISTFAPNLDIKMQTFGEKVQVSVTMGSRALNKHLGWILAAVETLSPILHRPVPDPSVSDPD